MRRGNVSKWIKGFVSVEQNILKFTKEKMERGDLHVEEITVPIKGAKGYISGVRGEVLESNGKYLTFRVESGEMEGDVLLSRVEKFKFDHESFFPKWHNLWQFDLPEDNEWLEENLLTMSECGFRIYDFGPFGYFFGIDGEGYEFKEAHWEPLFAARTRKWAKVA